jgi:hypothetical protein
MDAARLLADGTPVTLADGTTVPVRFDFEAMLRLESTYGSIFAFAKDLDARHNGKGFAAVLAGLQAGVKDRPIEPADLHPAAVLEYRDAVVAAYLEAMPKPEEAGKAAGRTEGGTGSGSTTSAPSGSAAPRLSGVA